MKYWLVRSPYKTRKWEDVLMSSIFKLYGIRNYVARDNISKMSKGDCALWYSSSAGKKIFGTMKVEKTAYQDNTSEGNWLSLDFVPFSTFAKHITFQKVKENQILSKSKIITQIRITVVEITKEEYDEVLKAVS
jgi:predicted RNA-binding protein with PUA-like domain